MRFLTSSNPAKILFICLIQISCYESKIAESDSASEETDLDEINDTTDLNDEESVDHDVVTDSIIEDHSIDDSPNKCIFNDNIVWIGIEYPGCEGEMDIDLDFNITEIKNEEVTAYNEHYGYVQIMMMGLSREEIVQSFQVDDWIRLTVFEYLKGDECIRGVIIFKTCNEIEEIVIAMRDGDLNNPWYPIIPNDEFFEDTISMNIEGIQDECEFSGNEIPGCSVQEVFELIFTNAINEHVILDQGEMDIIENGLEGEDKKTYRVMNNYSYFSEDCGEENFGYFIQLEDPPYICDP